MSASPHDEDEAANGSVLVVDARFRAQPAHTGVQQWAAELLAALPMQGVRPVEVAPAHGSGLRGHAWEQLMLPGRCRAERSGLPLLSPCNWGPLAVRNQALVLHDVAPLLVPEHFRPAYVTLVRLQLRTLARRVATILTVSESSRRDIIGQLRLPEAKVRVVGAGSRMLPTPDTEVTRSLPERYFAFVGAHDARKNLAFLLGLWPKVHHRTGAHLVVTRRPMVRTNRSTVRTDMACEHTQQPWYHELVSPHDAVLSAVLANAEALVWPSVYEGFGMPLLEAYQLGTGFLSSDTGVAAELALPTDPILPLTVDAWVEAIVARAGDSGDQRLRAARRTAAASYRWDDVAKRVVGALRA